VSLPIPAPKARLKMNSVLRLASCINSKKQLSKANKETTIDATKAKVAALQQIPNFPFHKPFF